MYTEILNEIEDLEEQISVVERRAARRNRPLDSTEQKNVDEMAAKIKDLKRELPVGGPLTVGNSRTFNALNQSPGPFPDFASNLLAIRDAALPNQRPDQRLFDIQAAALGVGETIPSEGGFLLQQDFSNELLKATFETGLLASRCRKVTISNNSNSIKINGFDETTRISGSRFGGIKTYWIDEGITKVPSQPKFRQIELNLKKLIGVCYATDEVLQDVTVLNSTIRDAFVNEFGFVLDDVIINGTGAGQPLGILPSAALVTVAKEAAQPADTIMTENIIKMNSRRLPSRKENWCWLINSNVESQLYTLHLDVGTGGIPVFMPANGLSGLPYSTLFGINVIEIEQAATLGDLGDIILANFPDGYILADKGGIKQDMSIHCEFLTDQSTFRFVLRADGQPALSKPITPYKGGATFDKSHFIALAER